MVFEAGDWFLCAALTPLVFSLGRRFPLTRATLARRLPLHFGFSLLYCVVWASLGIVFGSVLQGRPWTPFGSSWGGWVGWILTTLPFGVAVYFAMLGVDHAIYWFVDAARLQAQLADARMSALRMQLQPHFLLNSLNAITVIVRDRDTATATRMLEQLGDMLRRVMRPGRTPEVTLREELAFVRQYLAIEEIRFSDRLRIAYETDESLLDCAVPEFILQQLVENALRHGVARKEGTVAVTIGARREGEEVILSVTDDGPGPGPHAEGVGLSNTRERLATLYGDRARVELAAAPGGGARALVRLPRRVLPHG